MNKKDSNNPYPNKLFFDYLEPDYDPFSDEANRKTYRKPGNKATELIMKCLFIERNIEALIILIDKIKEPEFAKKLLAKYVIVEMVQYDLYYRQLKNTILEQDSEYKNQTTKTQKLQLKYFCSKYENSFNLEGFREIRNKIGAHLDEEVSGNKFLELVESLWRSINIDKLKEVFEIIKSQNEFLSNLPVYTWVKSCVDESGKDVFAFISPNPLFKKD